MIMYSNRAYTICKTMRKCKLDNPTNNFKLKDIIVMLISSNLTNNHKK